MFWRSIIRIIAITQLKAEGSVAVKSLIASSKGEIIGELPENFFPNGPTWLQLVFWSWENDLPQRIIPLRHSISVAPSEALSELYWEASEKKYKTKAL